MTKSKGNTSLDTKRKLKVPIQYPTCGLPIIGPLASSANENFHAICMDDNGLTIDQRKVAVDTASRQYLIETRDDLKTRFILNLIGTELFSGDGEWESDEHHLLANKVFAFADVTSWIALHVDRLKNDPHCPKFQNHAAQRLARKEAKSRGKT